MSGTLMTRVALAIGCLVAPVGVATAGSVQMAQAGERPCGRENCASANVDDGQSSGMKSWENRGVERPRGDCAGTTGRAQGRMMGREGRMGQGGHMMRGNAHRMGPGSDDARERRFGMHDGTGGMRARDGSCVAPYGDDARSDKFIGK